MATNAIETYTKHCQDVEKAYRSLHEQHLTVFGAFQRLQQASTGLRKSTEHIHKALDNSVADEERIASLDVSTNPSLKDQRDEQLSVLARLRANLEANIL